MKKYFLIVFLLVSAQLWSDGFMFLEVDGIQVNITDIIFGVDYANSETTASIALNRTVDLTGDLDDVFSGQIELALEFGYDSLEYDYININMDGGVSIKGHAYDVDMGYHVYTTSSGIGYTSADNDPNWTEPSDYDYLNKGYMYHEGDGGDQNETTFFPAKVTASAESLHIYLLVDTFKVAYYWDGQHDSRHGFVQTWNWENQAYFPSGTPVIGITYLPFYVIVNQEVDSETYVVASDTNYSTAFYDLPDVVNEKLSMFVTLVFDSADGSFFTGRTSNWDSLTDYSLEFPQFIIEGDVTGGVYSLDFSNFDDQTGWTTESVLSNFERVDVGQTTTGTYNGSTFHFYRVD